MAPPASITPAEALEQIRRHVRHSDASLHAEIEDWAVAYVAAVMRERGFARDQVRAVFALRPNAQAPVAAVSQQVERDMAQLAALVPTLGLGGAVEMTPDLAGAIGIEVPATCATCRHWDSKHVSAGSSSEFDEPQPYGRCAQAESDDGEPKRGKVPVHPAYAMDASGYHASLRTLPTFSCNQHAPVVP